MKIQKIKFVWNTALHNQRVLNFMHIFLLKLKLYQDEKDAVKENYSADLQRCN